MTETLGRVRVLPPDTPGLPPAVRTLDGGWYINSDTCFSVMPTAEVPGWEGIVAALYAPLEPDPDDVGAGFHCTRPPHDENEVHMCQPLDMKNVPVVTIVWGGE